eukprot:gnl/TRDRNA2_/TRDRNA2_42459_c0_seq2.p1 gnl/TRDRNA2_/TRDRNA2_42459_c0~~gnl/TRDRNA2_/TRDRNA2_42459_c0_seq2.p1  ORF type:complete len:188 (+),score=18.46 gnl/TRDRNA2_/TRDRNA2_42459_c0_seq2:25-564(+)
MAAVRSAAMMLRTRAVLRLARPSAARTTSLAPALRCEVLCAARGAASSAGGSRTFGTGSGRGDVVDGAGKLDEPQFHALADRFITSLHDVIDAADLDSVEDIGLQDRGTFVINKHYVTRQIWYASPISGALYFDPREDGTWFSEGKGKELLDVLSSDLAACIPQSDFESLDFGPCRIAE